MIEQESNLSSFPKRPTEHGHGGWRDYWLEQGFLWRTEPEIDDERKAFLASRLLSRCKLGDVNLAMVNWEKIPMLGDEYKLRRRKGYKGPVHESHELLRDY